MRDLGRYWEEVRRVAGSLPEFVSVVSAEGFLVDVTAHVAARLLLAKSHRLATEEQIRARSAREVESKRELARLSLRKSGIEVVAVKK